MGEITLYIAVSVDGYIATEDGSVAWLESVPNPNGDDYGYGAFYHSVDTTLMGRRTYEQIRSFDVPFPYPDSTNYVFSSTPVDAPDVVWGGGDAVSFVSGLKRKGGGAMWLVGGAGLNAALHSAGLIDRLFLSVMPVTLGTGIPLFAAPSPEGPPDHAVPRDAGTASRAAGPPRAGVRDAEGADVRSAVNTGPTAWSLRSATPFSSGVVQTVYERR